MKRCVSCNIQYLFSNRECPQCHFQPSLIDRFDSYAPEFAPWMNMLFLELLRCEIGIIKTGCSFPIGGSRFIVAKKEA